LHRIQSESFTVDGQVGDHGGEHVGESIRRIGRWGSTRACVERGYTRMGTHAVDDYSMRKLTAAFGTSVFFAMAPGVVAGLVPWMLTGWEVENRYWVPLRLLGAVLVAAGAVVLIQAFARFVSEGVGTPAPIAPTEHLVIGGLYRYVRNPMYLAVLAVIIGQALILGEPVLLVYGAVVATAFVVFVKLYEEPYLWERYGEDYESYRRAVPAWLPRRPRRDPPRTR
jgi:protein-S-isoprenylcysteine O-methyltransferase Ste14